MMAGDIEDLKGQTRMLLAKLEEVASFAERIEALERLTRAQQAEIVRLKLKLTTLEAIL